MSCGFSIGIDISAEGFRGGLSLGRKDNMDISLRSFFQHHIDVNVQEIDQEESLRLTGFYGSSIEHLRRDSWNMLSRLKEDCNDPWLVLRDFNEIMFSFEKRGGRVRE